MIHLTGHRKFLKGLSFQKTSHLCTHRYSFFSRFLLGPPRLNYEKSTNQTQLFSYLGNPTPINISCVWWGYPEPKLSIQKDGIDLPSQIVSLKTDDFLSYLEVSLLTNKEDDFGNYTCHASNSFGSASHVVVINKQGK